MRGFRPDVGVARLPVDVSGGRVVSLGVPTGGSGAVVGAAAGVGLPVLRVTEAPDVSRAAVVVSGNGT